MKTKPLSENRYNFIDVIRGAAIISMVLYHLCYDIFVVFQVYPAFWKQLPAVLWERSICVAFITVSGVSMHFSRHAYRRGIIVSLCGFAVTAVTVLFLPGEQIWFGVLNLIGCSMLITRALRDLLGRIEPRAGMAVSLGLFALTYGVPKGYIGLLSAQIAPLPEALYRCRYLAFLGLPSKGFHSADYFPLLPWLFLFLFGYFLWRYVTARGWDGLFRRDIPALSLIGRHSLIIYMAHQPLLYLLCAVVFGHF